MDIIGWHPSWIIRILQLWPSDNLCSLELNAVGTIQNFSEHLLFLFSEKLQTLSWRDRTKAHQQKLRVIIAIGFHLSFRDILATWSKSWIWGNFFKLREDHGINIDTGLTIQIILRFTSRWRLKSDLFQLLGQWFTKANLGLRISL